MKDNKPWYEKISSWITIITGICAILGISVFGGKSLIKDSETDNKSVNIDDSTISIGDQSVIVIGDNNTLNYENANSDSTSKSESGELPQSEADDFTVTASYDMNTAQTSFIGINVLINAKTSFPAECVAISAISDTEEYGAFDMHGGLYNWQYVANFYKKGTYTVTVTAYNSEGKSVSDEFIYVY